MKALAIFLMLAQSGALAEQDAAPEPPPEVSDQIVVIGQRMADWKGGLSKVDGELACKTKKSSGDEMVDAIRCGSMLACIAPLAPQIDEIMGSDLGRKERRARVQVLSESAIPCMEDYNQAAVLRLARSRAGDT